MTNNEFQHLVTKKAEQTAVKQARKELIEDEIKFLEIILKSNKGRDDCLIHMVKGRLDKQLKQLGDK